MKILKKQASVLGKLVTFETGKIARQANASIVARMGDTTVLCSVTMSRSMSSDSSFLPLTVHFIEKYYSAGKIPGGFIKRETKPSDNSVLTSRLIDRSIRPLFPKDFFNEVNVFCTVLSYDKSCSPDIVAILGTSAALHISDIPFNGPIVASRVSYSDGKYVLNVDPKSCLDNKLDLVASYSKSSLVMVESESNEVSEQEVLGAIEFAKSNTEDVFSVIEELRSDVGKEKYSVETIEGVESLYQDIESYCKDDIISAYKELSKKKRSDSINILKKNVVEKYSNDKFSCGYISNIINDIERNIVRSSIIKNSSRIDNRLFDQVRNIEIESGLLPKVHGSSLFTRGETQSLAVVTVGSSRDDQLVEGLDNVSKETFMLHYNFPPYATGDVGILKAPTRREVGHGRLAFKALKSVFPDQDKFPYTVRIVSEITESNGSSSMATVCSSSIALMDSGIPITKPVSGIAMGLIKQDNDAIILSDISGDEDYLGDMDFKIAGTKDGITALQMDIKTDGIDDDILQKALDQAKSGRLFILDKMNEVLSSPRKVLNENIPQVHVIKVKPFKIRELIGAKGKTIRNICETTGTVIDIDNDGTVKVTSSSQDSITKAVEMIEDIVNEPELDQIYEGKVIKIIDAGAFISITKNKDGFVHISELANYRVDFVEDIINEGDVIKVKVIGFDRKRRPKLSYRFVDQDSGEDIQKKSEESFNK